ncbi:nitroreductase [Rufibacter sp. DG15C]|uniref:NAD(P)H-dependent oxidoreductase n=1 Tax=Rufibacter sp. DG15C TaxID=1379909 RepID=UPI00078CB8BD|nr:NAD(P)H-dependent oxidoreductase [Rufibacter sp. DG15C]AMM52396.1 nitroreductase [Rufibacter sp. DG15C]
MKLIEDLNWRYATKRMTGEAIPEEKLNNILEAIRLSASSMGFQPYSVLVVQDPAVRKKIQAVAYNQPQIVEASHLLIFAAWANLTDAQVDAYMNQIALERGIDVSSLDGFAGSLKGTINSRTAEQNFQWAAKQSYIALGTGLVAAAAERVDATPMEGFDPAALDEILGLSEKGLRSVTIMALGYRDAEKDVLAAAKKVRRSKKDLFLELA